MRGLNLANEIWTEARRFISGPDRAELAETVVNLLIEHDYSAEEIKEAFRGDADIKQSLQDFLIEDTADEEYEEDYDEEDEEDY